MKGIKSTQVGANLKTLRRSVGFNQQQVAERMSMSRTTVVAIEQGKRTITPSDLAGFAQLYGVKVDAITDMTTKTVMANLGVIHVYIGYRADKASKGEKCFYCGTKASHFAYTYFGAPLCQPCWDNDWRQDDEGRTDPPFAEITNTSSGYWIGTQGENHE